MLKASNLSRIELQKGEDGYWLRVTTLTGKDTMICLNNVAGGVGLIAKAWTEWAEEQIKRNNAELFCSECNKMIDIDDKRQFDSGICASCLDK